MRKIMCLVTVCFLIISVFSGCSVLEKIGLGNDGSDELQPVSSIVMNEDEAKKLSDKVPIHLYFANEDNTKLKLEVRYIAVSEARKSVNNLAGIVMKELIKGPTKSGLNATVPATTKLNSTISIKSGVATVDLSKDFVDKHPGGKEAEQLTIYSIVNSLTELKEIQKVKFVINGKKQSEFKGNFKFDTPFPRSPSLISKDTEVPSSSVMEETEAIKQDQEKGKSDDNSKSDSKKGSSTENKDSIKKDSGSKTSDVVGNDDSSASFNEGHEEDEATYSDSLEEEILE